MRQQPRAERVAHAPEGLDDANLREGPRFVERGETLIMMAGRLSGHGLSSSVIVWTIGEDIPRR